MLILGFLKTTLLDYPGQVASTIFTGGCDFRCPFCHNSEFLDPANYDGDSYTTDEILTYLKKRRSILGGVAITGGEPTLQPDLRDFILSVRDLGLKVKLDTNGYQPDVLVSLAEEHLLDYVAMDIKSSRENYAKVSGLKDMDMSRIDKSISYLKEGHVPYEFRTTVVKELHTKEDFNSIAYWLDGAKQYFLQSYVDSEYVAHRIYSAYSQAELTRFLPVLKEHIDEVHLRGVDNITEGYGL